MSSAGVDGLVLSAAELERVRGQLSRFEWYRGVLEGFRVRVEELLSRSPVIPLVKGRAFYESCPVDHARLSFDPFAPGSHLCPKCGREWSGEVYDLAWVRQFQEWHAKRLVEAGILFAVEGDSRHARLVRDSLMHFVRHYREYPLANNLLGPTRLFQSTYLEAFWLVDMVAAYDLTRASPVYSAVDHVGVRELFYESAGVVRSFDEGVSNRQAFNNAGMGAVALLYDDEALLGHVLSGPHGFSFHMRESLLEDGIWYEGETYHFATLDHLLDLAEMARHRGIDLYHGKSGFGSLEVMFEGPLKVMLPDLTFPSRKDSWYGRGIYYHRDVYELGFARYGSERYGGLLAHAYESGADRTDISWRTFLHLNPELPRVSTSNLRSSTCEAMPGTGVAVLRRDQGSVYASLEYGHYGGGHGHPDRLHLSLHANGRHWLLDPGTGWYHVPELGWYRSTLAHNTVSVDGRPQAPVEGTLVAHGDAGGLQVAQARVAGTAGGVKLRRTLLLGDGFLVDVLDADGDEQHRYDLVLHTPSALRGAALSESTPSSSKQPGPEKAVASTESSGEPATTLGERDGWEFLTQVAPLRDSPTEGRPGGRLDVTAEQGDRTLRVVQLGDHERHAARAPGIPLREETPMSTIVARAHGQRARFATLYAWGDGQAEVDFAEDGDGVLRVVHGERTYRLLADGSDGVAVSEATAAGVQRLAWYGRAAADLPGVTIRGDRRLAAASLERTPSGSWQSSLPAEFGELVVSGLPAADIQGLARGAVSLPFEARDGKRSPGFRLRQAPGATVWRDQDDTLTLFAGCENTISFNLKSYGGSLASPSAMLPPDWLPEEWRESSWSEAEILEEESPVGQLTGASVTVGQPAEVSVIVALPCLPASLTGVLPVAAGGSSFDLAYRVAPPVSTNWRVDSTDGMPALTLEVREERGVAASMGLELWAPWLEGGKLNELVEIEPGGSHAVRLPLPATWPELEADRPTRKQTEQQSGNPRETEPTWPLPGLGDAAGEYLVSATLSLEAFVGRTLARLPLCWARPDGAETLDATLRLDREEQALWADRPWGGLADASAEAAVTWSEAGLKLHCTVRDDQHVSDGNLDDLYENDSLQVYFDFRSDHHGDGEFAAGVAGFVLAPSAELRTVQVAAIAGNREISNRGAQAPWFSAEGVEAGVEATGDGYRIAAFFPYASLGVTSLEPGQVIGFDLAVSDNDGTWYRNTQLLWSGSRGRRCYIRGSYHDPRQFGWLIVAPA
jgi:hypothetical protein